MLLISQILVRAFALALSAVALAGCGQQGPLYLPQAQGTHRATLPESLLPALNPSPTLPAAASSAPHKP